ncbi:hypothetical protein AAC387_Pa11g1850 [Persea americana]
MSCSCGTPTLPLSPPNRLCRNPNPRFSSRIPSSLSSISPSSSLKITIFGDSQRLQNRPRISPKSSILDLPLLPFELNEVLVPSECKTLHLYEARFLALLEESLARKKLFVHFVLEPVLTSRSSVEASFAARYGCLVLIENVERLEIGALVSIRGIGRVTIVKFIEVEPYIRGAVIPLKDNIPDRMGDINSAVKELKDALYDLNSLEIKLKDSKDEPLQTRVKNSVSWAEREILADCFEAFVPTLAERMSFAAFQPVSGSTGSELLKLQKEKLQAMDLKDTSERLANSVKFVKKNIALVAAKLAIQSIEA